MAESLSQVVVGPLFWALAAFLIELVVGAWVDSLVGTVFSAWVGSLVVVVVVSWAWFGKYVYLA